MMHVRSLRRSIVEVDLRTVTPDAVDAMQILDCDPARHGEAVLAILNDAILNSTALYEYRPRTHERMTEWWHAKRQGGWPVIGAVDDAGTLLGFASFGPFRAFPAYKYTVEHSVYVAGDQRGKGVGRALLQAIVERAQRADVHVLVGAIDSTNAASIALHAGEGFEPAGTVRQAGFKCGRWLDLAFYQRILNTPVNPVDG